MPEVDLSKFEDHELKHLVKRIEKELAERKDRKKKEAQKKIKELAASVGMTVEEIMGKERKPRGRRPRVVKPVEEPVAAEKPTKRREAGAAKDYKGGV